MSIDVPVSSCTSVIVWRFEICNGSSFFESKVYTIAIKVHTILIDYVLSSRVFKFDHREVHSYDHWLLKALRSMLLSLHEDSPSSKRTTRTIF